ncbi:ABC transporter permease [Verminephrobacter eiseniae]|uniref:Binding-protein-dependent transport systems inner membrane component n=1 Tax=Verminephrobacter eiseniae (strain EF01-2) TaxID=391735 RepID=A1WEZ1_VEREI|nr:ABC transporter permease [Verminephrobacter eiseniae]ABM56198.1 binding-protein-dependent transport systems inner membrane component [Verminephrobacter eiseniae EF01-2]MCW5233251.1 ABC transporter permease [Verminephrobacter eiseniae]MCW5261413.1 ABC transporter permease [Verminephrobacter eiseniae]MCW5286568.1 ABC transporter permease [Verminephrobacter eiseniae]MCW5295195.1 ABC transporter permease [Verminephrobacter eiseniae]
MRRLLMQRVLLGLLTLWLVSVLIFVGTEMLPGDVASAILGQSATPETVAALRASLGLDQPALQRYLMWLLHFLQGDLGTSLTNGRSIAADLMPRLYNTLFLASYAALVVIPLSILLGIASAIWQNSLFDRAASVLSLASISMPEFFVGYVLIILLAVKWALLPSLAVVSDSMSWSERLYATTLPMLTLLFVVTAHMLRMTRASVIAVMGSAYIEMAILKGLPKWRIVVQHALPNALAPIINAVSFNLAYLVVGVIMVEVVFVYPGVGQLMVDAVSKRDLPVVQACGLLFAAAYIGLNTLADVLAVWVNPRLRQAR